MKKALTVLAFTMLSMPNAFAQGIDSASSNESIAFVVHLQDGEDTESFLMNSLVGATVKSAAHKQHPYVMELQETPGKLTTFKQGTFKTGVSLQATPKQKGETLVLEFILEKCTLKELRKQPNGVQAPDLECMTLNGSKPLVRGERTHLAESGNVKLEVSLLPGSIVF